MRPELIVQQIGPPATESLLGGVAVGVVCGGVQPEGDSVMSGNPATLFTVVNLVAVVGWAGLAVGASLRSGGVRDVVLLVCGRWVPFLLCVAYFVFLAGYWGTAAGGGFQSLEAVGVLFQSPGLLLAGWTHYLAFDLLVGRWMVDDASSAGRSRLPLLVALPATFLFGPVGVLLYVGSRSLVLLATRGTGGR